MGGEGWRLGHILTTINGIIDEMFLSVSISDTSLYGFRCLNPFVIPSVKASTKKYTSSYFLVF